MLPDVRKGMTEYAERLARSYKKDVEEFQPWIDLMCQKVVDTASAIPDTQWLSSGYMTKTGATELKNVQNDMVIGPTDKSAHDFMMVCKHAYLHALQQELHSGVYSPTALTDEQIWTNHSNLATAIGRIPIKAHSYLYGAAKMHKEPANMRWIAGCGRQLIAKQGPREIFSAATSISPVATALGAILRFCMIQLERKDLQLFRPQGIKRYWIVTSVDTVAKHIKAHQRELAQEQVYTEDFNTMYTKLPHQKIIDGVSLVVKEAFAFYNPSTSSSFNLKWSNGDAEVVMDDKGAFSQEHVLTRLQHVVNGTFLKASADSPTL